MENTNQTNKPAVDPRNPPAVYEWTGPTGVKFRDVRSPAGTYYHDTTPAAVVTALDEAIRTRARLRIVYGDATTGRSWLEENDVHGHAGRSTGWLKTALCVVRSDRGGPAILADCVVLLFVDGREVYRHPAFNQAKLTIEADSTGHKSDPWLVLADGKEHARFKTRPAAVQWVDFMEFRRMTP
jgi:hypothetical protein